MLLRDKFSCCGSGEESTVGVALRGHPSVETQCGNLGRPRRAAPTVVSSSSKSFGALTHLRRLAAPQLFRADVTSMVDLAQLIKSCQRSHQVGFIVMIVKSECMSLTTYARECFHLRSKT
jgi:hypothetical protein